MVWIFLFKYNRQIINNNRFHYILILNEKNFEKNIEHGEYVSCSNVRQLLEVFNVIFRCFSLRIRKCVRNIKFNNIFIYSIF